MNLQNQAAVQNFYDETGSTVSEGMPQRFSNNLQAVIDITPSKLQKTTLVKNFTQGTSGSITIHATATGKKTYITGAQLWFQKDATSDNTSTGISCTVNGVSVNVVNIRLATTTAANNNIYVLFPAPILIDEGTNITCFGTFTVGAMQRSGVLFGYEVT